MLTMIKGTSQIRITLRNISQRLGPTQRSSKCRRITVETTRTIHTNQRLSCTFQTMRSALAVEASTARYLMYAINSSEEVMTRGWDAMNIDEDDDGT